MKSIAEFESLYIHRIPVDMRKSINGLTAIVQAEMKLDLRTSSLFIFCNQRRTHLKMIYFDRSGFASAQVDLLGGGALDGRSVRARAPIR